MSSKSKLFTITLAMCLGSSLSTWAADPPSSQQADLKRPASAPAATPAALPAVPVTATAVPTAPAASATSGTPVAPVSPVTPAAAAILAKKAEIPATAIPVLERFRTYNGPRTPAAMTELFSASVLASVRQQPEVVLSSGASMLTVSVKLPAQADNTAPNFAVNGASLLSSEKVNDEWFISVLPVVDTIRADLVILSNGAKIEIPLTVAPPLPSNIDLSEKAFATFLAGKGQAGQPLLDLNGDGKLNYQDDYIYIANYLVSKRAPSVDAPVAAKENRTSIVPTQADVEQFQRTLEQEAKGAAGAAEKPTEAPLTYGGGGSISAGSVAPVSSGTKGYTTTTTTIPVASGSTSGDTTGGASGGAGGTGGSGGSGGTSGVSTSTMTTITSPTGKSLTYMGTDKRNLNLRNLKAKENSDQLNSIVK